MNIHSISLPEWMVLSVGFMGQALFSARFLIQWIASERRRKSVVPVMFWYFSLGGGLTLFLYALYREDPVFMLGQGFGLIVYVRNLWLIRHERRAAERLAPPDPHDP
ncbi:MAG: lipid-A-disaccharide synthase N-terminal domain-containing protein [Rubrivivax sp.]